MQRRTVLAGMGTLLLAGCTSTTDDSGNGNGTDTTAETTTEPTPEPSEKPDTNFSFSVEAGSVKIVHTGNDNIDDETTKKLAVTVNGERVPVTHGDTEATYVLADDGQLGSEESAAYDYPFSIGNLVAVEASPADTVKVVWYPTHGEKRTLAEYTVPEATTTEATETTDATETTETTETTDA